MKQLIFTKQKTPPHPDESMDSLLTRGIPDRKEIQIMLITLQLYYEFKDMFSRLSDILLKGTKMEIS